MNVPSFDYKVSLCLNLTTCFMYLNFTETENDKRVYVCTSLKLPFRSQVVNFLNKHFKKYAYIYYNKNF